MRTQNFPIPPRFEEWTESKRDAVDRYLEFLHSNGYAVVKGRTKVDNDEFTRSGATPPNEEKRAESRAALNRRPDHREWLFMSIGWEIMDLRQDIAWAHEFEKTPYSADMTIDRLTGLQNEIAEYANAHFPVVERDDGF